MEWWKIVGAVFFVVSSFSLVVFTTCLTIDAAMLKVSAIQLRLDVLAVCLFYRSLALSDVLRLWTLTSGWRDLVTLSLIPTGSPDMVLTCHFYWTSKASLSCGGLFNRRLPFERPSLKVIKLPIKLPSVLNVILWRL